MVVQYVTSVLNSILLTRSGTTYSLKTVNIQLLKYIYTYKRASLNALRTVTISIYRHLLTFKGKGCICISRECKNLNA
jgi:hypothetical protein